MSKLGGLAGLAAADDGGVGLEDADHFVACRYGLAPEHASSCLIEYPLDQWHDVGQLLSHPPCFIGLGEQVLHLVRLAQTGSGNRE